MLTGSSDSAAIYFGLFNSQASPGYSSTLAPEDNLSDAGLSSSITTDSTGGVANYIGYNAEMFMTGNSQDCKVDTRPTQANSSNIDQDLVTDNTSSSTSYQGGKLVGSKASSGISALTASNTYTVDMDIDLTAAGTETITGTLYTGGIANVGNNADAVTSFGGATGSNYETNTFDSLGIGYRNTDDVADADMDVTQVEVNTVTPAPEPMSAVLLGLGGVCFLARRRPRNAS
jgi:hypothetical protein